MPEQPRAASSLDKWVYYTLLLEDRATFWSCLPWSHWFSPEDSHRKTRELDWNWIELGRISPKSHVHRWIATATPTRRIAWREEKGSKKKKKKSKIFTGYNTPVSLLYARHRREQNVFGVWFERPLHGSRPAASSINATGIFFEAAAEIVMRSVAKPLSGSGTRHRSYLIVPSIFTFSYDQYLARAYQRNACLRVLWRK